MAWFGRSTEGRPRAVESWLGTAKTVVAALLFALLIRSAAAESFNIPSGSMEPTLLVGDYMFVSKFSYGYSRYSLPLAPPIIPHRILSSPPARGDVAVFRKPPDDRDDWVKRVIGLPGDRIQVRRGILWINDRPVGIEPLPPSPDGLLEYRETLPNGVSHLIQKQRPIGAEPIAGFAIDGIDPDNTPVYQVPPDHYFMMGDNRDNSLDSRFLPASADGGPGYVSGDNLIGKAEILYFSVDEPSIASPQDWLHAIRFSRLLSLVR